MSGIDFACLWCMQSWTVYPTGNIALCGTCPCCERPLFILNSVGRRPRTWFNR